MKNLLLCLVTLSFVSCAGYHLGGTKPLALKNVKKIAVPMFENGTLHPRAEALATSAVINALVLGSSYQISNLKDADAVIYGKVASIRYNQIRGNRFDTLRPEELANNVTIDWKICDAKDPSKVKLVGSASGVSQLQVSSNLQTARNNALPEAFERAGEAMVSTITNGF
jgi:hypothetical protein